MNVTFESSETGDHGVCDITLPSSVDDSGAFIADVTLPDSSYLQTPIQSFSEPLSVHPQPSCSTPKKSSCERGLSARAVMLDSTLDSIAFIADITLPDSDCSGTAATLDKELTFPRPSSQRTRDSETELTLTRTMNSTTDTGKT